MQMAAEGETGGVSEKMQQWKIWFAERGVGPEDIPRAILAHEVVSLRLKCQRWEKRQAGGEERSMPLLSR